MLYFLVSTVDSISGFPVSKKLVYVRISPDMTTTMIIPTMMPLLN